MESDDCKILVTDRYGDEVKVAEIVGIEVGDDLDHKEATIIEITDPDVDDRDEQHPQDVPPYVVVRFPNGETDRFATRLVDTHLVSRSEEPCSEPMVSAYRFSCDDIVV